MGEDRACPELVSGIEGDLIIAISHVGAKHLYVVSLRGLFHSVNVCLQPKALVYSETFV